MKFGICLPIRLDADAGVNVRIAKRAEELGFDSVWASDHVVVPEKRAGMFTSEFHDPFVLLSSIAAVTSRIIVGTSVIILPYRNPLVTAKMAATLDVLSGGRLVFGVGPGWMREEFEALGVPFESRGRMTDEYIKVIRELWQSERPGFHGEFAKFSDVGFYPKPVQTPGPPVWVAGSSRRAVRRAALLGDGWQPTAVSPGDVRAGIEEIRKISADAGRGLDGFTFSLRNRLGFTTGSEAPEPRADGPAFTLTGSVSRVRDYVAEYIKDGVSHILFDPDADNLDEYYGIMETAAEDIIPGFRAG
ncbi:MAG: LLM class F420-dependent oxidoreductase [Candidatus Dadabacteria bacterium]|nr:LLM class F420-dependent oxidoreductase [Candidatus Dadabacteria bacterium]